MSLMNKRIQTKIAIWFPTLPSDVTQDDRLRFQTSGVKVHPEDYVEVEPGTHNIWINGKKNLLVIPVDSLPVDNQGWIVPPKPGRVEITSNREGSAAVGRIGQTRAAAASRPTVVTATPYTQASEQEWSSFQKTASLSDQDHAPEPTEAIWAQEEADLTTPMAPSSTPTPTPLPSRNTGFPHLDGLLSLMFKTNRTGLPAGSVVHMVCPESVVLPFIGRGSLEELQASLAVTNLTSLVVAADLRFQPTPYTNEFLLELARMVPLIRTTLETKHSETCAIVVTTMELPMLQYMTTLQIRLQQHPQNPRFLLAEVFNPALPPNSLPQTISFPA